MGSVGPRSRSIAQPPDATSDAWLSPSLSYQQQQQQKQAHSAANGPDMDMGPGVDSSEPSANAGGVPEAGSGTSGRLAMLPAAAPFDMFASAAAQVGRPRPLSTGTQPLPPRVPAPGSRCM